jgi:hypothetical protein
VDKLEPVIRDTPLTTQTSPSISGWYASESSSGYFTGSEFAWLQAQGWRPTAIVSENSGRTWYALTRRIIKPEYVLRDLVSSYTRAYNEGRQLNDQRYDDLVTLYLAVLDKTEDSLNELEDDHANFQTLIDTHLAQVTSDHATYAADVDGDLDAWGTSLLAEINARFDAELSKAQQSLIDRGMYSGVMWTTTSAGIERERTRALTDAQDKITQAQLALKHKIQAELTSMRDRVFAARERVRAFLSGAVDRHLAVRNGAAEALGRLVERRDDDYPDLSEVGRLAAGLGAGSAEAFSP